MFRLLLLPFLLLITGCQKNPVTGKQEVVFFTEEREIELGEESYLPLQQLHGGDMVRDPEVSDYVRRVGMKLASVSDRPDLPWEFTVINQSTPNAWALPGGKVGINRGLITALDSEAELAAVLAHEIAHAAARHGAQNMERAALMQVALNGLAQTVGNNEQADYILGATGVGVQLIQAKQSRSKELEADKYGIEYMVRAGYNPEAAITLQEKFLVMQKEDDPFWVAGLLSTHPPSSERVEANRKHALAYMTEGRQGRELYQRTLGELKEAQYIYDKLGVARMLLNDGQAEQALQVVEDLMDRDPMEAQVWGVEGTALRLLGREEEAIDALDQAIVLNDHYFDFFYQRALAYEALGNEQQMQRDLEKANSLLPMADSHYRLAELKLDQGLEEEALKHFYEVAAVKSTLGATAYRRITELELPKKPNKYIALNPRLDARGYLMVTTANNSLYPIEDVIIDLVTDETKQTFRFRGRINPSDSRTLTTKVGPFSNEGEMERAIKRLEITEIDVIR